MGRPIGNAKEPQEYATIEDAMTAAQTNNAIVWAKVGDRVYQVVAAGRIIRWVA